MGGRMLLKVLTKDLKPSIQGGEPYEIGVWHHCQNFDKTDKECAPGFYVIPPSELIHYHKPWKGTKVLPAEVKGDSRYFSPSKQRYEYMKLDSPLSDEQVKELCKEIEPELGYKLSEALYLVNALLLPKSSVTTADIELLKQWSNVLTSVQYSVRTSILTSVRASVWDSVWCSVWARVQYSVWDNVSNSIWYNIWDSVWCSVRNNFGNRVRNNFGNRVLDNVWDSVSNIVWVYVGSLFSNIQNWKYIDHEAGVYPFQPAVDLWYRGLLPVFDGRKWMLLSGKNAEIIWREPERGWLKEAPFELN